MTIEDIDFKTNPNELTAGYTGKFDLYISNYSAEREAVVFKNEREIRAKDMPRLSNTAVNCGEDATYFYLWFDYSEKSTSITIADNSDHIEVNPPEGWDVDKGKDDIIETYWILSPKATTLLAPGDNIRYKLTNIKCNDLPGFFPMYIRPVVEGERLSILRVTGQMKLPRPVITMFKTSRDDYVEGDILDLTWQFDEAETENVWLDGKKIENKNKLEVKIENRNYKLVVKNRYGCEAEKIFTPQCLFITKFECDVISMPGYMRLSWVTENADCCELTGIGGTFRPKDSYDHKITEYNTLIEFVAKRGSAKCSKTITHSVPKIVQKKFDVNYIGNDTVRVEWELENADRYKLNILKDEPSPTNYHEIKIDKYVPVILSAYVKGSFIPWSAKKEYAVPKVEIKKFGSFCDQPGSKDLTVFWEVTNADKCEIRDNTYTRTTVAGPKDQLKYHFIKETAFTMTAFEHLTGVKKNYILTIGPPKIINFTFVGYSSPYAYFDYHVKNARKLIFDASGKIGEVEVPYGGKGRYMTTNAVYGACEMTAVNEFGESVKAKAGVKR